MILGKIAPGVQRVRIADSIICTACSRRVPGGIFVSRDDHRGGRSRDMLDDLRASYLCGTCRDAARVAKSRRG